MTREIRNSPRRWLGPALVGVVGLALLWTMWLSGGDFWPMQRPFMPVTLACASIAAAAATLSAALPRSAWRLSMIGLTVPAVLATFLGEGLAERGRFTALRESLTQEVTAVTRGEDCTRPCRIDSREPLRVAFLLSGEDLHWSGVCYDATDRIHGVEFGHSPRPPDEEQAVLLKEASAMFGGQVRHAPPWGEHWYGCSTRH